MNNNSKGILGLLTLAAGAFGVWKYNKMTPEEKAALKDKARKAGDAIKESYNEVEDQVSEKLTSLKNALERETSKVGNTVHRKATHTQDIVDATVEDVVEEVKTEKATLV